MELSGPTSSSQSLDTLEAKTEAMISSASRFAKSATNLREEMEDQPINKVAKLFRISPRSPLDKLEASKKKPYNGNAILSLRDQSMGVLGMQRLCALVSKRAGFLSVLYLENNSISGEAVNTLVEGLRTHRYIVGVYLGNNNLGSEGGRFGPLLSEDTPLRELDLRANNLSAKEADSIAVGLGTNQTLCSLDLGENPIGDDGARSIVSQLRANLAISVLRLQTCNLSREGITSIARSIRESALVVLDLEGNQDEDLPTREAIFASTQRRRAFWVQCLADAEAGREVSVRRLVYQHKVSPYARDDQGNTLLHLAAQHGHGAVVAQLLDFGARPQRQLVNSRGLTPVDVATNACRELLMHPERSLTAREEEGQVGEQSLGKGVLKIGPVKARFPTARIPSFSDRPKDVRLGFDFLGLTKLQLPTKPLKDSPEDHYQKGIDYGRRGKYDKAIKHLASAEDMGHAEATAELADYLWFDKGGFCRDHHEALDLFVRAASKGSALAAYRLGLYWLEWSEVAHIKSDAFRYFDQAAVLASEPSSGVSYHLGLCYLRGYAPQQDARKAERCFLMAVSSRTNKGLDYYAARAATELARLYMEESGEIPQNLPEAIRLLERAANETGEGAEPDPAAAYILGECWESPKAGFRKDLDQARRYYRLAAEQGLREAQYKYGMLCLASVWDEQGGFNWLKEAAKRGHIDAQFEVGMTYLRSIVPEHERLAFSALKEAASRGHATAQLLVGRFYEEGYGTLRDLRMSRHYYGTASDKGEGKACYHLGYLHEQSAQERDRDAGIPELTTYADAYNFFYKRGAEQGDPAAALSVVRISRQYGKAWDECREQGKGPPPRDLAHACSDEEIQAYLAQVAKTLGMSKADDDAETYYQLARYYQEKYGHFSFPDLAERFYRKAAEQGHLLAMTELADLLGKLENPDYHKEVPVWLGKAAEQKEPRSMHIQGLSLLKESDNKSEEAGRLFTDTVKALQGSSNRGKQDLLALHYLYGLGVEQNLSEANRLLAEATDEAPSSNGEVHLQRGLLHLHSGHARQAAQSIKEAAQLGEARARLYLGELYLSGRGKKQKHLKARDLFQEAYATHVPGAAARLGYLYQYGLGVDEDKERAIKLYEEAVEESDPLGIINLTWCYRFDPNYSNPQKAEELQRQALLNFEPELFMHLAWLCREGICTSQDTNWAIACYQRAGELGVQWAQDMVEEWRASFNPLALPEPILPDVLSSEAAGQPADVPCEQAEHEQWPNLDDLLIEIDESDQNRAVYTARAVELECRVEALEAGSRQASDPAEKARVQQELGKLKRALGEVQDFVRVLWAEGEAKRKKREAIKRFDNDPNLRDFYRRFQEKVEQVFVGSKAIQGGATPRKGTMGKAAVVFSFLVEPAEIVPVVGTALSKTMKIVSGVAVVADYIKQVNRSSNVSRLAVLREAQKEIEVAARELTGRYADQLRELATIDDIKRASEAAKEGSFLSKAGQHAKEFTKGLASWALCTQEQSPAEDLAEFGALWICEKLATLDERPRLSLEIPLHEHLVTWVVKKKPAGWTPAASRGFKRAGHEAKAVAKEGVEIASKAVGLGVLPTRDGQRWARRDVFTKPGISTGQGLYSGKGSAPHMYRYRGGTEDEAKARDWQLEAPWQSSAMVSHTSMSDRSLALQNQSALEQLSGRIERSETWISVQGRGEVQRLWEANQDLSNQVGQMLGKMSSMEKELAKLRKPKEDPADT